MYFEGCDDASFEGFHRGYEKFTNFQIAVPIRRTNKLGWQSFTGIPKTRNHLERIAACHSKA